MTAPDNPYFARAMANWVWAQLFGKGLADPPDDMSRANPPVHPELLDALARHFVEHKFDLRDLIRTVAISEAYGLSSATGAGQREGHAALLAPDAPPAHGPPDGRRAGPGHRRAQPLRERPGRASRPPRDRGPRPGDRAARSSTPSAAARGPSPAPPRRRRTLSLGQSLLLIGGDVIENKVVEPERLPRQRSRSSSPSPRSWSRTSISAPSAGRPTAEELSRWSAELKQAASLREAAEDLFWALLNSREFAFNH